MSLISRHKKTKRKQKDDLIITWDTETYKRFVHCDDNDEDDLIIRPYLIGWFCEGKHYYSIEPHQKFFKFLEEKAKKYKLRLWCFNAMYDLPVILPEYLSKYDENYSIEYKISNNRNFISFKFKCKKFSFRVYDAAVWDPHVASLNHWFKLLGLPLKKEIHFDKWNLEYTNEGLLFNDINGNEFISTWDEEIKYNEWDCEGLYKVVLWQQRSKLYLLRLLGFADQKINSTTSASFAKKIIDKTFHDGYFDKRFRPKTTNIMLYKAMSVSCCGGFVACNKYINELHSPEGKIMSYDGNSTYPAIISNGLGVGELKRKNTFKKYVVWYECRMTYCKWIKEFDFFSQPPLPVRWCNLTHSFFLLKKWYDEQKDLMITDLEILDTYYQESTNELTDLINDLYKEKVKITKLPESYAKKFKLQNIKLLINSIFGKLAEKPYFEEHFYDQFNGNFSSNVLHINEYPSNMSGVYIVQRARAYMIKTMKNEIKHNGNIVLYTDTDSIKMLQNNPPKFKINPHHLGWFKLERCSDKCEGYTHYKSTGKTKKYLLYNVNDLEGNKGIKMALSGISRSLQAYLIKYGTLEHFLQIFDKNNNVVVMQGKSSREKNRWGQMLLLPLHISTNAQIKKITHKLTFDRETRKIIITKFEPRS